MYRRWKKNIIKSNHDYKYGYNTPLANSTPVDQNDTILPYDLLSLDIEFWGLGRQTILDIKNPNHVEHWKWDAYVPADYQSLPDNVLKDYFQKAHGISMGKVFAWFKAHTIGHKITGWNENPYHDTFATSPDANDVANNAANRGFLYHNPVDNTWSDLANVLDYYQPGSYMCEGQNALGVFVSLKLTEYMKMQRPDKKMINSIWTNFNDPCARSNPNGQHPKNMIEGMVAFTIAGGGDGVWMWEAPFGNARNFRAMRLLLIW